MSLVKTVEIIKKELYKESTVFIKIGNFYNVYFKDAILISALFGYKIKKVENDVSNCGFPNASMNAVKYMLEQKKINYIIIDRAHNYEEDEKMDFGKENTYLESFERANKTISIKKRLNDIEKFFILNLTKELIADKKLQKSCKN